VAAPRGAATPAGSGAWPEACSTVTGMRPAAGKRPPTVVRRVRDGWRQVRL
jgi:hypothetical protein